MQAVRERAASVRAVRSMFTPEHLQLLSDAQLRAVVDSPELPWKSGSAQYRRLAERELNRRHGRSRQHPA